MDLLRSAPSRANPVVCSRLLTNAGPQHAPKRGRSTLPEDLQTTWDEIREEMRAEVTDFIFHVWLEPLKPAGKAGDKLFVSAPEHVRGWVRERYGELLRRASARV